jgi:hypothetical protein
MVGILLLMCGKCIMAEWKPMYNGNCRRRYKFIVVGHDLTYFVSST